MIQLDIRSRSRKKIRLRLPVLLGIRLRLRLHPKTSDTLRLRLRNPDCATDLRSSWMRYGLFIHFLWLKPRNNTNAGRENEKLYLPVVPWTFHKYNTRVGGSPKLRFLQQFQITRFHKTNPIKVHLFCKILLVLMAAYFQKQPCNRN